MSEGQGLLHRHTGCCLSKGVRPFGREKEDVASYHGFLCLLTSRSSFLPSFPPSLFLPSLFPSSLPSFSLPSFLSSSLLSFHPFPFLPFPSLFQLIFQTSPMCQSLFWGLGSSSGPHAKHLPSRRCLYTHEASSYVIYQRERANTCYGLNDTNHAEQ